MVCDAFNARQTIKQAGLGKCFAKATTRFARSDRIKRHNREKERELSLKISENEQKANKPLNIIKNYSRIGGLEVF